MTELECYHIVVHYKDCRQPCSGLYLRPVRATDYETLDRLDKNGELWEFGFCQNCLNSDRHLLVTTKKKAS